ncbi:MAG: hypothetical protein JW795_18355 [Chitinivibrionales bacterium]|nr:hypothetical protein [Chitinivibrionales bacterium]
MNAESRMIRCICMLSGGLDSVIACHMLKERGIEVIGLHFVLPFQSGLARDHRFIKKCAEKLAIPLLIEEEGMDFVTMATNPAFGYGKNANPCMDCRIHRLKKASIIMQQQGASFIASGEVIGQRPKSQRRDCLSIIEKRSGLTGLLLRPLCSHHLPPTIPEINGWVDRSTLWAIAGRGRKEQLAYGAQHNLLFSAPAGGCPLTNVQISKRFYDLTGHVPSVSLNDFRLLAYGRHFRLSDSARMIIGRNESETGILEKLLEPTDIVLRIAEIEGPVGVGKGVFTPEIKKLAASILARYSHQRAESTTAILCATGGTIETLTVKPAEESSCNGLRL